MAKKIKGQRSEETGKYSKVRGQTKLAKKKSKVHGKRRMAKNQRSTVREKLQKIKCPWSEQFVKKIKGLQ